MHALDPLAHTGRGGAGRTRINHSVTTHTINVIHCNVMYLPVVGGVGCQVLHGDEWTLQSLGRRTAPVGVKGQHGCQKGHELQAVQLVDKCVVSMVTNSSEVRERGKNVLPRLLGNNSRLDFDLLRRLHTGRRRRRRGRGRGRRRRRRGRGRGRGRRRRGRRRRRGEYNN